MATAVLSNTPTTIDTAEATTNWVGDTFSLEPDNKVQGSNSVACYITQNAGVSQEIHVSGSWDFSSVDQHLRLWASITFNGNINTEANHGWQLYMSDGTNASYWTVAGSDTYGGGWKQFVIYTGNTPDEISGTLNKAAITQIGMRFKFTSRPRNVPANFWADAWYYGDGFTVTGGTLGDEIDYSHIAALDAAQAYGIMTEVEDIYFTSGEITIGAGATTTYFKPVGQKVQFKDQAVLSTLYQLIFEGSACNIDIQGGTISAAGSQVVKLDASDITLNAFSMTGVQASKLSDAIFINGQTVTNNVFNGSKQITPGVSIFQNNTISATTDTVGAVLLPSSQTNFKNNNFLDNTTGPAIEIPSGFGAASISDGDYFNGNTYDYNNLTGVTHTVSAVNLANPGSYTGTLVVFDNAVSLTVTVFDKSTDLPIEFAHVLLHLTSDHSTQVLYGTTNASGVITDSYNYGGDVAIDGWVRQWDLNGDDYVPQDINGTITGNGFSLSVSLDPI